jgi:hypothetical protein
MDPMGNKEIMNQNEAHIFGLLRIYGIFIW